MKRVVFALVFMLLPHILFAQPNVSGQGHWEPCNAVVPLGEGELPSICHQHIDLKCDLPPWSNFGAPMGCRFTIKLFQLAGEAVEFYPGILQGRAARDVVWDETGSAVPPVRVGDPGHHALVQHSGRFTVDPDPLFPHGWMNVVASSVMKMANGDTESCETTVPYYSILDLTAPLDTDHPAMSSRCRPFSPRRPDVAWGANQMDLFSVIPLTTPISQPLDIKVSAIRYGTLSNLPLPIYRMVADLDLHNDVAGKTLHEVINPPDSVTSVLNPADLGPGPHKLAFMLIQPDGGLERVASLLVLDIVVGAEVPPPPPVVCTPPDVLVNGQCVTPPPPPPPLPSTTLLPPLTMTVCDSSAPPKCSTVVVKD